MIEVANLVKRYGDFVAVSDVSFSAQEGEVIGFLGPNGAGKTTTLRVLTTYSPATSGSATVGGFDVEQEPSEVRRCLGYMPETPPLYYELTVEGQLRFIAEIRSIPRSEIKLSVERALERCQLKEVRRKLCGQLSKGFRQRVGLACAFIHDPRVVVLDEPTSGLDPEQIYQLRQLIADLAADRTVLLSTHLLPEVTALCSRILIMSQGKIALDCSSDTIQSTEELEQVFLGCVRNVENGSMPLREVS